MKTLVLSLFAAVLMGLCTVSLWGQIEAGRVIGTVTDQTGAVVNGATVTLTNNATGVVATEATQNGVYAFTAVQAGTYTLKIEMTGFAAHITNNVEIHVQQTATVDAQLAPGKVTEQVVVNTTTPLLQTENAEVGQTIGTIAVNDMPLNGRQWSSLGLLAPGVSTASPGHTNGDGALATPSDRYYSVNGQAVGSNDFRLNGLSDMAAFFNSNGIIQPPPDAIQEFKISTGDFSAELGHGIGGVVNAVLKSGSNQLHGDVWDYFRNNAMDAKDYFTAQSGASLPELRQNQFGGAVGGPIYIPGVYDGRDKSFFFYDMQWLKSITPDQVTTNVPTGLMQSSNFTNLQDMLNPSAANVDNLGRSLPFGAILDPATTRAITCGTADPVTGLLPGGPNNPCTGVPAGTAAGFVRDPFFNGQSVVGVTNYTTAGAMANLNMLPAGRIDANALALLKLFPSANNSAGSFLTGNDYFKNYRATNNNPQLDLRVDHNISSKDIINGFYSQQKTDNVTPDVLGGVLEGGGYTTIQNVHQASGSYTHVFTPTLTNEFRLGYTKESLSSVSSSAYTLGIPAQFGIQGIPQVPGNGGLPVIGVGGLATMGPGQWNPTYILQHDFQVIDNVTKIKGKHILKAGVDINALEGDIFQPPWGRGELDFSGNYTDVPSHNNGTTAIGQFLLSPIASSVGGPDFIGGPNNIIATSANWTRDHRWYNGLYFADSYKVTPTLTIDMGLRWDVFTPYQDRNGNQANFIPNNGGNGPGGTYYIPQATCGAPANAAFYAQLAEDGITKVCSNGLATGTYDKTDFAPRFGIAKRITSRYVLRAGFGMAYGALDSIGYGPNIGQNYPFYYTVSYGSQTDETPLRFPDPNTGTLASLETGLSPIVPNAVDPHGLGLISRYPYDQKTPYSETYNLTNQYQITQNDSVTFGYVGSMSRHLISLLGNNQVSQLLLPNTAIPNEPGQPSFIPFPGFSGASYHATTGSSAYNSVQANYEHRFSFGLQALANYTWAHCLSDGQPQEGAAGGVRALFLPGFGQRQDYMNCVENVRHTVHFSGTYKVPFGAGMRWQSSHAVNAILGNWQLNWIYSYQSGNWLSVGCPTATTTGMGCGAVLSGDPYAAAAGAGPHRLNEWLNASAFSQPTPPTAADADANGVLLNQQDFALLGGRGSNVTGPSWYNIDASIFKEFHLSEARYFQFRAEAFNVLNNPQFSSPNIGNFNTPGSFSQITSVRNTGREMQLALKFYF